MTSYDLLWIKQVLGHIKDITGSGFLVLEVLYKETDFLMINTRSTLSSDFRLSLHCPLSVHATCGQRMLRMFKSCVRSAFDAVSLNVLVHIVIFDGVAAMSVSEKEDVSEERNFILKCYKKQ